MKIALISDIHANMPALEAVLADLEIQKPDAIYCLGDLVGYNVWPNEVIREIRKRCIPTIAGNYDQGVGIKSDDCGCAYKTDEDKTLGKLSIAYTNESIGDEERSYLRTLPAHLSLEFKLAEKEKFNFLMVHGSPRKINEYLYEERDETSLLRIIEQAKADLMAFGHTHKPYHRVLAYELKGAVHFRHAINTGSVGKPKDGDPRASYAMVTINDSSSMKYSNSLEVDICRVEYDVEKAAKAIEESSLPNEFAEMLRLAV